VQQRGREAQSALRDADTELAPARQNLFLDGAGHARLLGAAVSRVWE